MVLTRTAERELNVLRDPVLKRVVSAMLGLATDPRPRGCRKLVGRQAEYRLRVGDYRVMYRVDDERRIVRVSRIRHRGQAYD